MEKEKNFLEELRKNNSKYLIKIKCPCCGNYTHRSDLYLFEICEVCHWQYDEVMHDNPNMKGGSNKISLNEARSNYKKFGVKEERFLGLVRHPFSEELPENN